MLSRSLSSRTTRAVPSTRVKPAVNPPVKPTYAPNPTLKPTKSALLKMRKENLQVELQFRGIDNEGTKDVLVNRLMRALTEPTQAFVAAPRLPSLENVAKPSLVPAEERIVEALQVETPDAALTLEVQQLQCEKVEMEAALRAARSMLAENLKKDEFEKAQLKQCMMSIEKLALAGDADRDRLQAAAGQLAAQLAEAQQESSALQQYQAQLSTRVGDVTRTLQAKEGELVALQGQMAALRNMAGQVASIEMPAPGQIIFNLAPATKRPAYPALVALAGSSMLMDAASWVWKTVRESRPAEERLWVDAAGVAAAITVAMAVLHSQT